MSISKNVLLGCLCFFIVFWHVFKNKSKTKLLNPSPKPLTFPQGYLFFLGFYMVSNGTRDLKQAETTTNKFAMPRGEKWQRVRSCHFFCQSLKITTNQESKTPRNQKKKQDCTHLLSPKVLSTTKLSTLKYYQSRPKSTLKYWHNCAKYCAEMHRPRTAEKCTNPQAHTHTHAKGLKF